jgi:hypothetical protein
VSIIAQKSKIACCKFLAFSVSPVVDCRQIFGEKNLLEICAKGNI